MFYYRPLRRYEEPFRCYVKYRIPFNQGLNDSFSSPSVVSRIEEVATNRACVSLETRTTYRILVINTFEKQTRLWRTMITRLCQCPEVDFVKSAASIWRDLVGYSFG